MKIVRFRPEHLRGLVLQTQQQAMQAFIDTPQYGACLSLAGPAYTVFAGDHPVACIGLHEYHLHRAEAWALLGDDCGPHLRAITKAVRGYLEQSTYARVEANVATDFEAGRRWARLLSFVQEGPPKERFYPDGGSALPFVRLRNVRL